MHCNFFAPVKIIKLFSLYIVDVIGFIMITILWRYMIFTWSIVAGDA